MILRQWFWDVFQLEHIHGLTLNGFYRQGISKDASYYKLFYIIIRILIKKAADYRHFLQDKEITDKNKETSSIHGLGAPVGCKGQEILEGNLKKK